MHTENSGLAIYIGHWNPAFFVCRLGKMS